MSNAIPPKPLIRLAADAITDYGMIRDGDRILLGLSGGKDSWSLLHVLLHLKRRAPVRFDVGAVTIDPQSEAYDPSSLKDSVPALGVAYYYRSEPLLERAKTHMKKDSYCAWCARMKRGIMYTTAREHGYNVIALGQHLDDLAESFLMSAFHGGRLNTMKAHYRIDAGDLRVIRPLVYARERQMREFAERAALPVIPENCPACFAMPTQRMHMKDLLAQEEANNPKLFKSLLAAMRPLMDPTGEATGESGEHGPAQGATEPDTTADTAVADAAASRGRG